MEYIKELFGGIGSAISSLGAILPTEIIVTLGAVLTVLVGIAIWRAIV